MPNALYNPHFEPFFLSEMRHVVLWGTAGSAKSYTTAQKITERCTHNNERHKFLVLRKFKTTIEGSVFTLLKHIVYEFGLEKFVQVNNTKMSFTFHNGNEIITSGLDEVDKLKSIHGITGVWMEEADQFEESDLGQINLRLRGESDSYKQIIMTLNPVSEDHWIKKKFFDEPNDNVFTLWCSYKHNLFIDDEYKKLLETEYKHDPNMYRIYVLGLWGRERTGGEFYLFDRERNIAPVTYMPEYNIHISFDFNISPYLPVSLWHIWEKDGVFNVGCFDLLIMENPLNNTEDACKEFVKKYPNHDLGVFIYGDASGRVRSTQSHRHNYDIIEEVLKKYIRNWSWRVPRRNPLFNKRRDFMNRCLAGGYDDIRVIVNPECEMMITDFENVLTDEAGKKWVKKAKNKAGVPYEKYGHLSDTADYLLCSAFEERFKNFGNKL